MRGAAVVPCRLPCRLRRPPASRTSGRSAGRMPSGTWPFTRRSTRPPGSTAPSAEKLPSRLSSRSRSTWSVPASQRSRTGSGFCQASPAMVSAMGSSVARARAVPGACSGMVAVACAPIRPATSRPGRSRSWRIGWTARSRTTREAASVAARSSGPCTSARRPAAGKASAPCSRSSFTATSPVPSPSVKPRADTPVRLSVPVPDTAPARSATRTSPRPLPRRSSAAGTFGSAASGAGPRARSACPVPVQA
jgi:hypothetical protein